MRVRRVAAGVAAAGTVAIIAFGFYKPAPSTASPAHTLYRSALDRELDGDAIGAASLLRASIAADPTYLPSLFEYVSLSYTDGPGELLPFLDSMAIATWDPGMKMCFRTLARAERGLEASWPEPASGPAEYCRSFSLHLWRSHGSNSPTPGTLKLWRDYSFVPSIVGARLSFTPNIDALVDDRAIGGQDVHPLSAARLLGERVFALHRAGRDAEAVALERAVVHDRRWNRRGFRLQYLSAALSHASLLPRNANAVPAATAEHNRITLDRTNAELASLAEELDPYTRALIHGRMGTYLLDRGRLPEARTLLMKGAAIADSLRQPAMQAYLHMRVGRALVKMGEARAAERELLFARDRARVWEHVIYEKESEHNLLHLYEGTREHAKAERAGLAFERLAAMQGLSAVRMMSAHDVALFYRARGDAEAARPHFARMLADIDSLGAEFNFAADYYESIGDLDRAETYYARGLEADESPLRALAGLVRVSRAKGRDSDAFRWARLHDEAIDVHGLPESEQLLPGLLLATGRKAEGRAALEAARRSAAGHSQLAAWASLTLSTAELELDDARFGRARALADSATQAAARTAAMHVQLRAAAVGALAAIRDGAPSGDPLARIDRQIALAAPLRNPQLSAELHRMRGGALEASGRWRESLTAFKRVAHLYDSVASGIQLDPERAGYRSVQRRVYDQAIAAIVAHASEPDAAARFAEWSMRRKTRGVDRAPVNAVLPLPSVRRAAEGSAVLDFIMMEREVAVLVLSPAGTSVVRLPAPADSVRATIRSLRAALDARIGSSVDLTHATYSRELAARLYDQLLRPVETLIAGARDLTIVPDGALNLVPFDALVIGSDPAGNVEYVVDRYTVREAVSLGANTRRRAAFVNVLAVAPDNVGDDALREARAVAAAFPGSRSAVLSGSGASESAVRARANGASILHFAAHATMNVREPSSSALRLVSDGADDGELHAFEIARLTLPASLIVLSACETAAGPALEGEGVLSLTRSFFQAGAHDVVATLWPVGPQAARFMTHFYASLSRGAAPASAVREAKLALRRAGETPFTWAPFVAIQRTASGSPAQ